VFAGPTDFCESQLSQDSLDLVGLANYNFHGLTLFGVKNGIILKRVPLQ
jgi:hypothetical protein